MAEGWRDQAQRISSPDGNRYRHDQRYPDECIDAIAMSLMKQMNELPTVTVVLWSNGACSIEASVKHEIGPVIFSESREDRPSMALIRCAVDSALLPENSNGG